MRSRRLATRAAALCAVVPVLALGAGCGGDGDGGGLDGRAKLDVLQARADIAEYCSVQKGGESDLSDRSLGIFLEAVRDLARVYRENPNEEIEIPVEDKTVTTRQVLQEQIRALRSCGRFGRQQAGVLQAVAEQQDQAQS